jgi:hypothetical protein
MVASDATALASKSAICLGNSQSRSESCPQSCPNRYRPSRVHNSHVCAVDSRSLLESCYRRERPGANCNSNTLKAAKCIGTHRNDPNNPFSGPEVVPGNTGRGGCGSLCEPRQNEQETPYRRRFGHCLLVSGQLFYPYTSVVKGRHR